MKIEIQQLLHLRPARLYTRILTSFLAILLSTIMMIYVLFRFSVKEEFQARFELLAQVHAWTLKELFQEKLANEPGISLEKNQSLFRFLVLLSEAYDGKLWIATTDGRIIQKSFFDEIPRLEAGKLMRKTPLFQITIEHGKIVKAHIIVNVGDNDHPDVQLHIFLVKPHDSATELFFLLGLVGIALFIALITIPLTRTITRPVNQLKTSAMELARGNLSHRANIIGCDEIGELGQTFNQMVDEIESMIRSTRELTANLSHELRSPLARIRILEGLLRRKSEMQGDQDQLNHLNRMCEEIEELDHLIGIILQLSKIDIINIQEKREPLILTNLIEEEVEKYLPGFEEKKLSIKKELHDGEAITINRDFFRTILSNLLHNAIKYAASNSEVKILLEHTPTKVFISMSNYTDPESAPTDIEKIFEPFARQHRGDRDGYGLGLTIAKRIVERFHGSIRAEHTQGIFTISIELPIIQPGL